MEILKQLGQGLAERGLNLLSRKFLVPLLALEILRALKDLPGPRFYTLAGVAVVLGVAFIVAEYRLDRARIH